MIIGCDMFTIVAIHKVRKELAKKAILQEKDSARKFLGRQIDRGR
jgi:hypothetical protein